MDADELLKQVTIHSPCLVSCERTNGQACRVEEPRALRRRHVRSSFSEGTHVAPNLVRGRDSWP